MNIEHNPSQQAFFIHDEEGKHIAELTYTWQNNEKSVFSIDHTWVDDSLRGQGIAKKLFDASVNFARENKLKILPICSYAVVMFQRDASLADLRA